MTFRLGGKSNEIVTLNKQGLHLEWPRIWIIILGILLIFLCFCIAGMEIGHTVFDLRRSTAFGGFIIFIPLLICAILILITAFKPHLILLHIAMILSFITIILCLALIAYDIVVLVDPTRCFFFNCNDATVNVSNSTTNVIVYGWPLNITWPNYFLTNMNAKRIFQSIQILWACLFILFGALYILTYFIYQRIHLHQKAIYHADQPTFISRKRIVTPTKYSNNVDQSYPKYSVNHSIITYSIEGHSVSSNKFHSTPRSAIVHTPSQRKIRTTTSARPRANSMDYDRICTQCMKESRMILKTNYDRQNFFPRLCVNCNNEFVGYRRKPPLISSTTNRTWKP